MGPNGEPIATPSVCLYKISLKMKYDSLVPKDKNSLNPDLFKLCANVMVSSGGMLVKSESTSKLPQKVRKPESHSTESQ